MEGGRRDIVNQELGLCYGTYVPWVLRIWFTATVLLLTWGVFWKTRACSGLWTTTVPLYECSLFLLKPRRFPMNFVAYWRQFLQSWGLRNCSWCRQYTLWIWVCGLLSMGIVVIKLQTVGNHSCLIVRLIYFRVSQIYWMYDLAVVAEQTIVVPGCDVLGLYWL